MKIFGREPALWLALVAALVMAAGLAFHLSSDAQAGLNAAAVAVVGVITAATVHDGVSAAVLGLVKALVALVLAFGLHLSPDWQVAILTLAAAVTAMFVRTQATAPVPAPRVPIAVRAGSPR